METWKEVPESEGRLKISTLGEVIREEYISPDNKFYPRRILKHSRDTNGYPYISFKKGNKRVSKSIHRLLAELFVGGRSDERNFVNHKNFDKSDFSLGNLEWVSCRENNIHAKNRYRKITEELAEELVKLRKEGDTYLELSKKTGIHKNTIRSAIISSSNVYTNLNSERIIPRARIPKEIELKILSDMGVLKVSEIVKKYKINRSKYYRLKRRTR